jgi:xenotropic and polytropic retrovirus receptor 1
MNAVERILSLIEVNRHSRYAFRVGFLLCLTISFVLHGIIVSQKHITIEAIPQVTFLLQLWAGFGLLVLFLLLFGVNCYVWHNTEINYAFLFAFDTDQDPLYRQYLEACTTYVT